MGVRFDHRTAPPAAFRYLVIAMLLFAIAVMGVMIAVRTLEIRRLERLLVHRDARHLQDVTALREERARRAQIEADPRTLLQALAADQYSTHGPS